MKQQTYAFWKYDLFPFVLGGEVTKMHEDGLVETVGFGPGARFRPFLLLPLNAGQRLREKLDSLESEERKARKEHDDAWAKAVRDVMETAQGGRR
jgi:hypothetical protein